MYDTISKWFKENNTIISIVYNATVVSKKRGLKRGIESFATKINSFNYNFSKSCSK
jgi:hypothetical protein